MINLNATGYDNWLLQGSDGDPDAERAAEQVWGLSLEEIIERIGKEKARKAVLDEYEDDLIEMLIEENKEPPERDME